MNAKDQRPIAVELTGNYTSLMSYDGSNNLEYLGKANIGSATSDSIWQIKKFIYSGSNMTGILYADGNELFDNLWDDRTSLSYS